MNQAKSQFLAGVRSELPILVGVIPFGLIFGVLAANTGLSPYLAWGMSQIIFAGSAQFLALPLIQEGAPPLILILTTFIINLRHLLYSASLAPYARPLSQGWKWLLSYLLTDEAYVPTIINYQDEAVPATYKQWYWLGAGIALWITWQLSTAIGIFFGAQLPEGLGLEFTLALTFIGIVVPTLNNKPTIASALSAGLTAIATYHLPYKLNLMVAALVGIAVGLMLERQSPIPTPAQRSREEHALSNPQSPS